MRGLPPLPFEVLELRVGMDQAGSEFGFVQHIYQQGSIAWNTSQFQTWIDQWGTFAEIHLLNCMPSSCSFTTCRLARTGTVPLAYETVLPANSGAHGQCSTLNAALVMTWLCAGAGFSARAHTRLPLPADAVNEDKRTLINDFWGNYRIEANDYLLAVNSIVIGPDPPSELVVVSRSTARAPRAAAVYAPAEFGAVSRFVGTLQSRIR